MIQMRRMPVDIQDFPKMRENGYVYVDKTALIYKLTQEGQQYFLGRPRRFGKSLLCSTLRAYFEGRRELFGEIAGQPALAISELETQWKKHPVLHLMMNSGGYKTGEEAEQSLNYILRRQEEKIGLPANENAPLSSRFEGLIAHACQKTGEKVVVIIDEYDKPLTDNLTNPSVYDSVRQTMQTFYSALKASDEYLRFTLLTGVTKFSKVSIFSTLNHLDDISLNSNYAALCGITEKELSGNYMPEIEALAQLEDTTAEGVLGELRKMYNGYHFSDEVTPENSVYNPFSAIHALKDQRFNYYWFSTGTPTFLVQKLEDARCDIPSLESGTSIGKNEIEDYRPESTNPIPLLYQTGYLTITGYEKRFNDFILAFPNEEVRIGFLQSLLPSVTRRPQDYRGLYLVNFIKDLDKGDVESFMNRMTAFLAGIPGGTDSDKEHYIQTIFYMAFTLMGEFTQTEVKSAKGRSDMVVYTDDAVYCFEFKLPYNGTACDALAQIGSKDYLVPYSAAGKRMVKVGAVYDPDKGSITEWKTEEINICPLGTAALSMG